MTGELMPDSAQPDMLDMPEQLDDLPDWLQKVAGDTPRSTSKQVEQKLSTTSLVALLIVCGVLAVIGYALYLRYQTTPTEGPAPKFTVTMYDTELIAMPGETASLESLRGQVVVINFWASYCLECIREAPMLERTWQEYQAQGVVFLGVNTGDPPKNALDYLAEYEITYPNAPDKGGRMEDDYRITGIPETFVINKQGKIVRHFIATPNEHDLRSEIDRALQG